MITPAVAQAAADVLDAAADTLATLGAIDRRLRVLAGALRGTVAERDRPRRRATAPTPSVDFSDLDAAKADRALARVGVRPVR